MTSIDEILTDLACASFNLGAIGKDEDIDANVDETRLALYNLMEEAIGEQEPLDMITSSSGRTLFISAQNDLKNEQLSRLKEVFGVE